MMTCQPAVKQGLSILMACYAKIHLKIDGHQSIHAFHVSVAYGAIEFPPYQVRLVSEFDIVRNEVDPHPWNGGLRIEMLQFLNQLRMLRYDVLVAEEAFLELRDTRISRPLGKRVTESAVDLFHSRMHPVAEKYRLLRPDSFLRKVIVKIERQKDRKKPDPDPPITSKYASILLFVFSHPSLKSPVYATNAEFLNSCQDFHSSLITLHPSG
jgi:hypothetical protein